jgi:UDP-glucuronate decarboxylase
MAILFYLLAEIFRYNGLVPEFINSMKKSKTLFLESDVVEISRRLTDEIKDFSGKTVFITGGMGFLGRYLAGVFSYLNEHCLASPCRIIVADNLITTHAAARLLPRSKHLTFLKQDVTRPIHTRGHLDFIIHAAGIASPYYYRKYPLQTLEVATTGTRRMLDLARKNKSSVLFFSSSEIYGDPDPNFIPTPEDYNGNVSCLGPRACYDEGKRLGETLCRIYHEYFGVRVKIVRPFNVYGPGMAEKDYRVVPNFASAIIGKQPLNVYASGCQTRTFCYVTDAMVGFLKTLLRGRDGEAYNIGTEGPEISILGLAKEFARIAGVSVKINQTHYPESYIAKEPLRRCPDLRKAKSHLAYEPAVELREGLSRFLGWAKRHYTGKQSVH